jgi:hypothetical protein
VLSADEFSWSWHVQGPEKDGRITTRYTRCVAPAQPTSPSSDSGVEAAGAGAGAGAAALPSPSATSDSGGPGTGVLASATAAAAAAAAAVSSPEAPHSDRQRHPEEMSEMAVKSRAVRDLMRALEQDELLEW